MLNEEVARYRELSGDTTPNVPISRIGGYLDGYEKALEQEPKTDSWSIKDVADTFKKHGLIREQEPCEDCISRQAVLDKKELIELEDGQSFYCISPEDVETLPPVTPQPKTGNWINGDCKGGNCSICGEYYAFYPESGDFNYCPNCGTKMIDLPDTNVGKLSEIPTGSDDELYSDCIDAFKEYALGRKERRGINGRMDRICNSKNPQ